MAPCRTCSPRQKKDQGRLHEALNSSLEFIKAKQSRAFSDRIHTCGNDEAQLMSVFLVFLPFVALIAVLAAMCKLAARMLRYGGISWPGGFLVAALIVSINMLSRGLFTVMGMTFPLYIVLTLGPVVPLVAGAWYFHKRATRADGSPVDWMSAFKASGLALGLYLLFGLVLFGALMVSLPSSTSGAIGL